jgi:dinuclear metal center YbgI/SA1388 family protein
MIDQIAPFDTQADFDNAGFLIGDRNQPVQRMLLCLDLGPAVIREAKENDVQLIISHHPVMFNAIKRLTTDTFENSLILELVRNNISLISAHTNLDQSVISPSNSTAELLGLNNIEPLDQYMVMGELEEGMQASEFLEYMNERLNYQGMLYGRGDKFIQKVAVGGGGYSEGIRGALDSNADALVTGEVDHHHALEATANDLLIFEAGHLPSEYPALPVLADYLRRTAEEWSFEMEVFVSCVDRYDKIA